MELEYQASDRKNDQLAILVTALRAIAKGGSVHQIVITAEDALKEAGLDDPGPAGDPLSN